MIDDMEVQLEAIEWLEDYKMLRRVPTVEEQRARRILTEAIK